MMSLPNNKPLAVNIYCQSKKIEEQFRFFKEIHTAVNDYIERGYARKLQKESARTNYLPHHDVIHPNKPDEILSLEGCENKHYQGIRHDCSSVW